MLSEPTTCFRIKRKEIRFHKIGPIMMPKRIGHKISTISLFARVGDKMTKTDTADLVKCASKIYVRTLACDIRHADKYWIRPKMSALRLPFIQCTIFLDNGPFVDIRG